MKKINIIYWTSTLIFAALMLFSAIPDAILSKDAVAFMTSLGYPDYFTQFIGVAKILGVIAILLLGFSRITEWAYMGLFFDLFGAIYSMAIKFGFDPGMLMLLIWVGAGVVLYIYYHKKTKLNTSTI